MAEVPSLWLERHPVAHPDHLNDLEREAAMNEFGRKMPRHEAEAEAHKSYTTKQREAAAGHHLMGMKVAQAAGDMEASRKHGVMYQLHMKALGHNSSDRPPPSIESASKEQGGGPGYRFRPHRGDVFAVLDHAKKDEDKVEKAEPKTTTVVTEHEHSFEPMHVDTTKGPQKDWGWCKCGALSHKGKIIPHGNHTTTLKRALDVLVTLKKKQRDDKLRQLYRTTKALLEKKG